MAAQGTSAPTGPKAHPIPARPKQEREPLLVDVGFQVRSLFPLLVFAGLYTVLLLAVLFIPLARNLAAEPDMRVRILLQAQLWQIHFHLWPLLGVAGLIAAYLAFYRSLRTLRPVYRLHYALRSIAAGDHQPLLVQPQEEFRFLADDVAQLNQKMKLIATRNRDILLNVNAHIKRLADRLASEEIIARAELKEIVAAIHAQLEKAPELARSGRP